ncbi:hypothetical protein ECZU29_03380 [Escherichia coli]|nr:hypothetical protein ECZU29_03380 [Escherichia coli]
MSAQINNIRPEFDREIVDIVDYVMNYEISSKVAYDTAHYCLLDTLGCGLEALEYPACKKLLGPIVPGTVVPNGVRVPGTQFQLDPVRAAFNIGAMIRWLDFNDTGWRRSGGILPTTSAAFWQRQTGFRATRSPAAKRR